MNEIVKQYGEVLLATAGTLAFLTILGKIFWCDDGVLIKLIYIWGGYS